MQKKKGKEKKLVHGKEKWWIGISTACIRRMKELRSLPISSSSTRNSANCSSIATPTQAPQEKTLLALSLSLSRTETVLSIDNRRLDFRYPLSEPDTCQCSLGRTTRHC